MKIKGIEGLSYQEIQNEVERGGRFVVYKYCISIVVMTFMRPSAIHFVRATESRIGKSLPYTLTSCFAGWWGFPWGPIYSIASLAVNAKGGEDVTADVLRSLIQQAEAQAQAQEKIQSIQISK